MYWDNSDYLQFLESEVIKLKDQLGKKLDVERPSIIEMNLDEYVPRNEWILPCKSSMIFKKNYQEKFKDAVIIHYNNQQSVLYMDPELKYKLDAMKEFIEIFFRNIMMQYSIKKHERNG